MTSNNRRDRLIKDLKNKKDRDAFVFEHINTGIPFQIRVLRKQRKWTQKHLASLTNMEQVRISQLENPNYASFTISTLLRVASAFDVGLIVRFVPFSELVRWEVNLSQETLTALSFNEEYMFQDKTISEKQVLIDTENTESTDTKVTFLRMTTANENTTSIPRVTSMSKYPIQMESMEVIND